MAIELLCKRLLAVYGQKWRKGIDYDTVGLIYFRDDITKTLHKSRIVYQSRNGTGNRHQLSSCHRNSSKLFIDFKYKPHCS